MRARRPTQRAAYQAFFKSSCFEIRLNSKFLSLAGRHNGCSYWIMLVQYAPRLFLRITGICAVSSKAVSYTHLDVYKRQVWNRHGFIEVNGRQGVYLDKKGKFHAECDSCHFQITVQCTQNWSLEKCLLSNQRKFKHDENIKIRIVYCIQFSPVL